MKGVFLRKKFNVWLLLLFLSGVYLVGMALFLRAVDPESSAEAVAAFVMGILLCLTAVSSWLLNYRAFIHIDGDSVKARYHWRGRIDCKLSDVDFAFTQLNTLNIQLKDGKTHSIMGVQNAGELCLLLQRNLAFERKETPEALMKQLKDLQAVHKKNVIPVFFCIAILFINIFVTVFLTGGREMVDFTQRDWVIFSVMAAVELSVAVVMFLFAAKAGKAVLPQEKLRYRIRRTVIETAPPLPGNAIRVFADENFTYRVTVFGYPNDPSVYYTAEELTADYTLRKGSDSEIYENEDLLPDAFAQLVDITETVLPK